MEFPWLPVNATLIVWSAEELHLLKGDGAGETAGNGRMKGKKRVQCSSSYGKVMIPEYSSASNCFNQILITFLGNILCSVTCMPNVFYIIKPG